MNIEDATRAGELAAKVADRTAKIEAIQKASDAGWLVTNIRAVGPENAEMSLVLDTLDDATSKQAFGFAIQIYQAQLDALNKELAAL